jgi:hypothetical protein
MSGSIESAESNVLVQLFEEQVLATEIGFGMLLGTVNSVVDN